MPGAFKVLETHDLVSLVEGDIFVSSMQMLVNPVNTVGVMGRGLALQFKNMYPEMFLIYCE
jgi:O-acetyl-ADP-ribose deacetylase (regulator of RNase III)